MKNENDIVPRDLRSSDLLRQGQTPEGEKKASSEFGKWLAALRDYRLADKAGQLWRLFKSGKLSGFDKAIIVAAILYCIAPADTVPDLIPAIGYLDDLLVVLGVLTYLDRKVG